MLVRLNRSVSWQRLLEISQWVVPFIAFYFIWMIIDSKSHNVNFLNHWNYTFSQLNLFPFILSMIFLTGLNLFFESLKWKYALGKEISISTSESLVQTLKAMAAGFITPFRSGAILARFVSNDLNDKWKILDATLRMAIAQFTVTFLFGLIGLSIWSWYNSQENILLVSISLLALSIAGIIYFSFHPPRVIFRKTEWKGFCFDKKLIFFSLLRYLVFTSQYISLLWIFGAKIEIVFAFGLVSLTFLVNTLLPTGILGKIGIRELSGILIIGESTGFVMEVSCAAFLIWILNQALPAILGSMIFLGRNPRLI